MTIDLVSNSCIISLNKWQKSVFYFFHETVHCVTFASGNNFHLLVRLLDANFISFYFNGVHVNFLSGFCLSHLFLVSI
nr:MAG TPA: hypothetical protein [Caudoviricetes sp.]